MLDEEESHRSCKSKRFISKVMFMPAVARPRYDSHNKKCFDVKLVHGRLFTKNQLKEVPKIDLKEHW